MCGIAGLSLSEGAAVTEAQLELLGQRSAHRGPDGYGTFIAGNLGLVHRRLAIVDVVNGQQPFTTADDTVALIANGEIYNHQRLRQRLAQRGILCTTGSDCEPPLLAYCQSGLAALDDLEGMYGLALADTTTGDLVLARDPFGIKPLYYLQGRRVLLSLASRVPSWHSAGTPRVWRGSCCRPCWPSMPRQTRRRCSSAFSACCRANASL